MFANLSSVKILASPRNYFARHSFEINFVNNLGTATMSRGVRGQLSQGSLKDSALIIQPSVWLDSRGGMNLIYIEPSSCYLCSLVRISVFGRGHLGAQFR